MWVGLLGATALSVAVASASPCPEAEALQAAVANSGGSLRAHQELVAQLRLLRSCAGPEHAIALGQAFVRSRHGALAEDPDLFESALIGIRQLSHADAERALREGVLPELLQLTWEDLRERWLLPRLGDEHGAVRDALLQWRPARRPRLRASASRVEARVLEGYRTDPAAFLLALSAHGGSISQEAAADLRDALLSALVTEDSPVLQRVAAEVGVLSGHGGPRLAAALRARAALSEPAHGAALLEAAAALPEARRLGPILPPATPPGQLPGLEWTPPRTPDSTAISRPTASPALPRGGAALLGGLALVVLAAVARRRRSLAGPAFGLGLLLLLDGTVAAALPELGRLPELGFIPTPSLVPEQRAGTCWYGGPGTRIEPTPCARSSAQPLVAVVGASSVHGSHYVAEQAFPAQLQQRLAPRGARVLNLGIGGASSATLAGWAGPGGPLSAAGGGPVDVLVVYYGHNEAAQLAALGTLGGVDAGSLRRRLLARRSGLFSLFTAAVPQRRASSPAAPAPADPDAVTALAAETVRHHLGILLRAARAAGVEPVIVLPATNLRFAHVELRPGAQDALLPAAEARAQEGDGAGAARLLQRRIDQGASPRELVSPVREALVSLAQEHEGVLIDAQAAFLARAPDGVSPSGLFWDDLHPSADGHAVLAELIAPAVDELLDRRGPR